MKKGIFLFFLLGIMSYGKNISLDTMLKELDEKSYNREIYEIQNKINSDKEKYYKLDDFNGVETSATSNYSNREDAFETNPIQTMIDSETARELIWEWDESVHKYVVKEEEETIEK